MSVELDARTLKRKMESLELHQVDSLRRIDEMKFESENLSVENRKLVDENQGLSSGNSRLKVLLEEKEHDLSMAQANLASLTQMLEEKSVDSESVQQERLHNLAGKLIQSDKMICRRGFAHHSISLPW